MAGQGALEMRRDFPLPGGPSRSVPARQPRATGSRRWPSDNRSRFQIGLSWTQQRWIGGPFDKKKGCLKRSVHRGRSGANQNTARGTPEPGGLAVISKLDKPRCREASRPVGPPGPLAFRAPSSFWGAQDQTTACPGPLKNAGDDACPNCRPRAGGDPYAASKLGTRRYGLSYSASLQMRGRWVWVPACAGRHHQSPPAISIRRRVT